MPDSPFVVSVSDLTGSPGSHRTERIRGDMPLELDLARVDGPVDVAARYDATSREIVASGAVSFDMRLVCHRCLLEFQSERTVEFSEIYAFDDRPEDEVQMVGPQGRIDLEPVVRDEVGLALPLTPTCRPDCRGLCPSCGTDLNTDPCEGHDDQGSSPFAVLQQLFEPQD